MREPDHDTAGRTKTMATPRPDGGSPRRSSARASSGQARRNPGASTGVDKGFDHVHPSPIPAKRGRDELARPRPIVRLRVAAEHREPRARSAAPDGSAGARGHRLHRPAPRPSRPQSRSSCHHLPPRPAQRGPAGWRRASHRRSQRTARRPRRQALERGHRRLRHQPRLGQAIHAAARGQRRPLSLHLIDRRILPLFEGRRRRVEPGAPGGQRPGGRLRGLRRGQGAVRARGPADLRRARRGGAARC